MRRVNRDHPVAPVRLVEPTRWRCQCGEPVEKVLTKPGGTTYWRHLNSSQKRKVMGLAVARLPGARQRRGGR